MKGDVSWRRLPIGGSSASEGNFGLDFTGVVVFCL